MTTISLRDCWAELLLEQPPTAQDLRLRFLASAADARIFAAVTAPQALPCLLVELPQAVRPLAFKQLVTRAFQMTSPTLTGLVAGRWAILIELRDRTFSDLFEILAADVLQAAVAPSTAASVLDGVVSCINRWRRFVERRAEPLSDDEVRGLIGELVVLCRCMTRFGADAALAMWKGPDRRLHDFELPDAIVEVKTFQGDDRATVVIAQPDQLDTVASRPLYLAAVRITPSETEGLTLADFVARSGAIIAGTHTNLSLDDVLAEAGYLPVHAPLYAKRFVAGPLWMFEVAPGFPRIRSTDVPTGVVDVRFALSLSALADFRIDPVPVIGDRVLETEGVP